MTENEHLLLCLAEECDEVGQRVMKALRFGLDEIQPGQPFKNSERIVQEMQDLISVAELLRHKGVLADAYPNLKTIRAKEAKIAKFMEIGRREGALSAEPVTATEGC
jgi:hypothetical protein